MIRPRKLICPLIVLLLLPLAGCVVVVGTASCSGPTIWTDPVVEERSIDVASLTGLEIRTHKGSITFEAQPAGSATGRVTVTKKGGGMTPSDAEEALEAMDVFIEPPGDGTQRIGWRWNGIKDSTWRAKVSFDVHAPGNIDLAGNTHNGHIKINNVVGDVRATSHNGRINVKSSNGKLYAKTHNGRITAAYVGDDVTLLTHNGKVVADLDGCTAIDGRISAHNGNVEVVLSEQTSTFLKCRTSRGKIRCNVPLNDIEITRHKLTGAVGKGEGNLDVTTHNGSIRIKNAG